MLSTKLKAKTIRAEAPSQSLSATRSLSRTPLVNIETLSAHHRMVFCANCDLRLLVFWRDLRFWLCIYRLLAREGINAEELTRDLKSFELKVISLSVGRQNIRYFV